MKPVTACLALMMTGCSSDGRPASAAAQPTLDLIQFFSGRSAGEGTIKIVLQDRKPLRVASVGRAAGPGLLVLDQRITEGAEPTRMRRWQMNCTPRGRCRGSLTDATGQVRVTIGGNAARIHYEMKRGLKVEQWLVLRPDRRTLDSRLRVSKWGVTVARVDEVIRKLG